MTALQPEYEDLLAEAGRPLLGLVQHLTGMETSFVTAIDRETRQQDVVLSLNSGSIEVEEGARIEWSQSLCRSMLVSGCVHSTDVGKDFPESEPARAHGIRSFFALPILIDGVAIGTVCGASALPLHLSEGQVSSMQYIAMSLRHQLDARIQLLSALARADAATRDMLRVRREADEHRENAQRLEVLANTDPLTGLANRRAFNTRWKRELARSGRRGYALGVLLLDIDSFKSVNDSSGHAAGDAVLVALSSTLKAISTKADILARLGGDEFALGVSHTTAQALFDVAVRIRQHFANLLREAAIPDTTLSIGIAVSVSTRRGDLLAAADRALYGSKARAGDCAELSEDGVDAQVHQQPRVAACTRVEQDWTQRASSTC